MTTIRLPESLDLRAAADLRTTILAHRGEHLLLDASAVERVGGLCLQVLIAAQREWALDRMRFELVDPSAPCRDALALAQATMVFGRHQCSTSS